MNETSINIYARKTNRRNWFIVAMCHNDKREFIRQLGIIENNYKGFIITCYYDTDETS
jgi:hypothetical protein